MRHRRRLTRVRQREKDCGEKNADEDMARQTKTDRLNNRQKEKADKDGLR